MSDDKLGPGDGWLSEWSVRLRRQGEALRLSLAAADSAALADPAAWTGAAVALLRAADGASRLEVSIPESADKLIDVAVHELVRQGLRFLQLEHETDAAGGAAFVAHFLPSRADQGPARSAFVLRHERTGQTWEVTPRERVLVGRDDCTVRVGSPRASGQHCAIAFARRAFVLIDLRSSAGTFLDNLPMRRGIVEELGRICLGRKETGHYLEMELTVPPGAAAFLHVINGANAGQSIPLLAPVTTIGRATGCDLQLDAPYISREHLRIALVTDCYTLTDLASTNGTILNGRPVRGGRLVPGDRIEVGEDGFTFETRDGMDGFFQPGWRIKAADQEALLDRPHTTIGRDPGCDFLSRQAFISRRHARLVWERPGRLRLYDLASFGGTAVAGRLVADAELHGGEALAFGPVGAQVVAPK